jgi:DNA-directed RNA polymerase subunit H (RpoH/RPB5)
MSSNNVLKIYKSRNVLIEQLKEQEFEVEDYGNFSINEIDAMLDKNQLDMIASRKTDGAHVYVKYFFTGKQLRPQVLDDLVEELFEIESILKDKTKDIIVLVTYEEPNASLLARLEYLYDKEGYYIVVRTIARLQFNVLQHTLVPFGKILLPDEVEELRIKLNLKELHRLPEISRFDEQALSLGVRPGQIVKFNRKSPTALFSNYWRICV